MTSVVGYYNTPLEDFETSFNAGPYIVSVVDANSPAVRTLRGKFFEKFKIPIDIPNPNLSWFCIYRRRDKFPLVVFSIGVRFDGGVEGCDFYVVPIREGAAAAAFALKVSTQIIDSGAAPYFYMWVLGKNKAMHKRLERAFGVDEPTTVMYRYSRKAENNGG